MSAVAPNPLLPAQAPRAAAALRLVEAALYGGVQLSAQAEAALADLVLVLGTRVDMGARGEISSETALDVLQLVGVAVGGQEAAHSR